MDITSFQEIVNKESTILILGTMPGIASLEAKQYYGHPNNLFWDIIFRVCNPYWKIEDLVSENYEDKKNLLIENQIALWDVLRFCNRKGNLDKDIRNKVHNDFKTFFQENNKIKTVFFNGKKAAEYFNDYKTDSEIFENRTFITLPSTSPSNTMNSFSILREWLQIRKYINIQK